MKQYLKILFCFILFIHMVKAQDADSLLSLLPNTKDTTRVKVLNDLCFEYAYNEPEKGKRFGYEALQLATNINYILGKAKALNRIGIIHDVTGNYDSAIYCYQIAGVYFASINNLKGKGSSLNNIGMLHATKGDFSKALFYYFESLKIFEALKNEGLIANVYNNIGIVYSDLNKYNLAYSYFTQSAAINKKIQNLENLATNYTNIGRAFDDLKMYDSALYYFHQSEILEKEQNNIYGLGILYNNIALTYKNINLHSKVLTYLFQSLKIKQQMNDRAGEASCLLNIADEYSDLNDDKNTEKYLLHSLQIGLEIKSYRIQRKSAYCLFNIYNKRKDYANAVKYVPIMNLARDSSLNEESSNQIIELEVKYKNEKQSIEIEKQHLELKNAHLEIEQKRSTILLLLVAVILIFVTVIAGYNKYRNKQQRELDAQLLIQLELRNKAIIEAEIKERIRIARELHDGIGQQLSAAKMNLSAFENRIKLEDKNTYELLIQLVDDAVKEVRSISHNMMPNALLRSGLVSAVRDFVNKLSISDALKIDLQIVGLNQRLDSNTETILYRVLQECLSNIIKHAEASHISIQLIKHNNYLNMIIEDNGKGFDSGMLNNTEGIGLKNMQSRVQFLDGTIEFDSTIGKGTTVIINIPLNI